MTAIAFLTLLLTTALQVSMAPPADSSADEKVNGLK